jgi:hypothetical protein
MANGEVLSATTVIVDLVYRVADGKLFVAAPESPDHDGEGWGLTGPRMV